MDTDLPPYWAIEKARQKQESEVLMKDPPCGPLLRAFARYIAEHEEAPVDPLVLEARTLVECTIHWSPQTDRNLQAGKNDASNEMKVALAALRRGIEIGKSS